MVFLEYRMVLVTGGAYNGKLAYVIDEFSVRIEELCNGRLCELDDIFTSAGVYNFHILVRRLIDSGRAEELFNITERIISSNIMYIISDETGMGVIPIDDVDRQYREYLGKILCKISMACSKVIRVYYGIPQVLKDVEQGV